MDWRDVCNTSQLGYYWCDTYFLGRLSTLPLVRVQPLSVPLSFLLVLERQLLLNPLHDFEAPSRFDVVRIIKWLICPKPPAIEDLEARFLPIMVRGVFASSTAMHSNAGCLKAKCCGFTLDFLHEVFTSPDYSPLRGLVVPIQVSESDDKKKTKKKKTSEFFGDHTRKTFGGKQLYVCGRSQTRLPLGWDGKISAGIKVSRKRQSVAFDGDLLSAFSCLCKTAAASHGRNSPVRVHHAARILARCHAIWCRAGLLLRSGV
jgi:hypothetical protein